MPPEAPVMITIDRGGRQWGAARSGRRGTVFSAVRQAAAAKRQDFSAVGDGVKVSLTIFPVMLLVRF
jgi:hypothetical protein